MDDTAMTFVDVVETRFFDKIATFIATLVTSDITCLLLMGQIC